MVHETVSFRLHGTTSFGKGGTGGSWGAKRHRPVLCPPSLLKHCCLLLGESKFFDFSLLHRLLPPDLIFLLKFFLLLLGLLLSNLLLFPTGTGMNKNLQIKRLLKFFLLSLNFLKTNFQMEMHLQKIFRVDFSVKFLSESSTGRLRNFVQYFCSNKYVLFKFS